MKREHRQLLILSMAYLMLVACSYTPKEDPNAAGAPMIMLGRQMLERNDLVAAQDFFSRALEKDPENFTAHKEMADTVRRLGNLDSAASHYQKAIELVPNDAGLHRDYGRLLLQQGQGDAALRELRQALNLNSDDTKARAAYALALDQIGDHKTAQAEYRKVLEVEPNNLTVGNNLAYSYLLAGNPKTAIELLEPVQDAPLATAALRQNLALAYGLTGMELDAERVLKRDLPPAKITERLTFYRQQQKTFGFATQPTVMLARYNTQAMAEAALLRLQKQLDELSDSAKLSIVPSMTEAGGVPHFVLQLTGGQADDLTQLKSKLLAE